MKITKFTKIMLALPIIAYSIAASAEIKIDDQKNVSYTGLKNSSLSIAADGSVSVNGSVVHKCAGNESNKVTKTKTATITCDVDYVTVRDKAGNELDRFSSYAKATDAKGNEERQLYDPGLAKIGSATTGADVVSQVQQKTLETKEVTTVKQVTAPAATYLDKPKPANINERLYTPKLGTEASKTPDITKYNTPADTKADHAVAKAEKEAKKIDSKAAATAPSTTEMTVKTTEVVPDATLTTKTVTFTDPTPDAEKAGAQPSTTVKTNTVNVPADGDATTAAPNSN